MNSFEPHHGLIIVTTELAGPSATAIVRLALDTGATGTLVNAGILSRWDTTQLQHQQELK
jgi:hypothetical protein